MQATVAAGAGNAGNANNGAKPSVAAVPAPLIGAEDETALGMIVVDPFGIGVIIRNNNNSNGGASFVRDNPANGATICINVNCGAGN